MYQISAIVTTVIPSGLEPVCSFSPSVASSFQYKLLSCLLHPWTFSFPFVAHCSYSSPLFTYPSDLTITFLYDYSLFASVMLQAILNSSPLSRSPDLLFSYEVLYIIQDFSPPLLSSHTISCPLLRTYCSPK